MNIIFVLGGGVGNIVQATPTLKLIAEAGHKLDLKLECNSSSDLEIFNLPFINKLFIKETPNSTYDIQLNGPFTSSKTYAKKAYRPKISYAQNLPEAYVYANLAEQIGIKGKLGRTIINVGNKGEIPDKDTVAIYCGSKPDWAMKRWDKYDQLADKFEKVTIVGKPEDINSHGNPAWIKTPWNWGKHVNFFNGSLRECAFYISKCKMFIGNDGGLAHVAAATGVQTFVLFGPSSDIKNKPFSPDAYVIAIDLACRPCQFKKGVDGQQIFGPNKTDCPFKMKCMIDMNVEYVIKKIEEKYVAKSN